MREDQNFFKHADRDPDAKLAFHFETTKFYLFDAARLLVLMTNRQTPETAALTLFFLSKFPHYFRYDGFPDLEQAKTMAGTLNVDDFEAMLAAIDNITREGQQKVNTMSGFVR